MAEFVMPSLGSDMEAGTLVAWLKQPGDRVQRGDIIAEVDTDKGVIEVEVFASGIVERLLVAEGTKVPVNTPLAVIREEAPAPVPPVPAPEIVQPAPLPAHEPPATPAPVAAASLHSGSYLNAPRVKISPSARLRARELGVSVELVHGTGPGGAITRDDIERAAARPPVARGHPLHRPQLRRLHRPQLRPLTLPRACVRRLPRQWHAPTARFHTTT
jgi:pyruvate dehydrogenase E2 component (dihydrolipoamide acetyltransferase)